MPINVSTELYKEIEADMEEYYNTHLSHWGRIWESGKKAGYKAVVGRFDLKCQVVGEYLKISLTNKENRQVVWERGYAYSSDPLDYS